MEMAFKVSFVLATAVEAVLVAVLLFQLWRRQRHEVARPLVLSGGDALSSGCVCAGAMALTLLFTDGWDSPAAGDIPLYGATFGMATAGLVSFLNRRSGRSGTDQRDGTRSPRGRVALLLPLGFGVLAGLAGV
ncbi:hypothetical protein [Streptomyces sp. NPDC059010]|uniref:hypothetical protein n=1 Tax=Streptomyces sp. NPDC059010 TaxID=3346695 RepID=UPI0036B4A965